MVRALEHERSMQKSKSFHFKRIFDRHNQGNAVLDSGVADGLQFRSQGSRVAELMENQDIGWVFDRSNDPVSGLEGDEARTASSPSKASPSDMELMKERFAKLLLGEDMSGGGKGVSSALALSNAITNLAASIFGEQRRLEPMSPERKARWRKEIDWLLSVTDHIVEFVPSTQKSQDGTNMEVMITRQRNDLHMNIPALRKLDAMLLGYLDNFGGQNEFSYVSRNANESEKGKAQREDEKWWLPTVEVPPNGLSDGSRKWLLFQKESVNQVLKAAMAINAQVLSEMSIPEDYIESLPKNGRASLGDSIYKCITVEYFDPDQFLSTMDLSTEHKVLDLKDKIEASIVIWMRKMHQKDGKSTWGSAISLEKRELFEERAETILLLLKQRFPGIPQSSLDTSKIQFNKDVGQSILESYSRVIESLAFTVISRIEDVLYADSVAQNPSLAEPDQSPLNDEEEVEALQTAETPNSKTLSDFMGWKFGKEGSIMKRENSISNLESFVVDGEGHIVSRSPHGPNVKKVSYLEKLENLSGLRSPTDRH
ncbi:rho guanine nucleotide exchange factor 8-like [Rhodamnia argentea]|uniref:Rho guanine nucleotide exchange factor 8-like n=1 Tax=Rhodamnia argentea TaxID=178133 RepID=A0A8B8Q3S1_9MYRT|nr:rho guanine nucleotide exchange factor 8-like [Rhodamnia argentea]